MLFHLQFSITLLLVLVMRHDIGKLVSTAVLYHIIDRPFKLGDRKCALARITMCNEPEMINPDAKF